jgi:hypothetical protein
VRSLTAALIRRPRSWRTMAAVYAVAAEWEMEGGRLT